MDSRARHDPVDCTEKGTRVVRNSRGYQSQEPNPRFDEWLIVEVEAASLTSNVMGRISRGTPQAGVA